MGYCNKGHRDLLKLIAYLLERRVQPGRDQRDLGPLSTKARSLAHLLCSRQVAPDLERRPRRLFGR